MNKNQKRLALMGLAASMLLFLSGCVSLDKSGNPTGWVWNLLGRPMSHVITYFADNLGLGFGLGIIFVTIIVRLIILPLTNLVAQPTNQQNVSTLRLSWNQSTNVCVTPKLKKKKWLPSLNSCKLSVKTV